MTEERVLHLCRFLRVALQLEQLRHAWAGAVLELDIDSPDNFRRFTKLYDSLVVAPLVQSLRDREVQVRSLCLRVKEAQGGGQPTQRQTETRARRGRVATQGRKMGWHSYTEGREAVNASVYTEQKRCSESRGVPFNHCFFSHVYCRKVP